MGEGRMGSYLSIENNTNEVWQVKLGPDEAALQISGYVGLAIGTVAGAIATAGAAAPLAASLAANGVVSVFGVSTATAASVAAAAASVSGIATAGTGIGGAMKGILTVVEKTLKEDGYVHVKPGQKQTYGKMSLSLWQQGTCVHSYPNPDNPREIFVDTLYMRPIFSGPTDNSENTHQIQFWLDKWGVERTVIAAA